MTGKFYIDGADAHTTYGVLITSYEGIVQYHPLKPVEVNDWPDENGIDPDLSEPTLDSKVFSIGFSCLGDITPFINLLKTEAYHSFQFPDLGTTRVLRLVSQPEYKNMRFLHVFSLSFADDFPLDGYEYTAPDGNAISDGFTIDDIDLSSYGMRIEYGIYEEIRKTPEIKANLTVNNANAHGSQYDGENVFFKPKNVSLNLQFKGTKESFWKNYNALLYDLIRPGDRSMKYSTTGVSYFYYLNSEVRKVSVLGGGIIWCQFTLNLCFTMADPILIYLLSTGTGELIETEDGIYFIELA